MDSFVGFYRHFLTYNNLSLQRFFLFVLRIRCSQILCKLTTKAVVMLSIDPGHAKMCLMPYANNKGADQPAHPRSLISAFIVRSLDSIIFLVSRSEIPRV